MDKRILKISFNKAGSGSITKRLAIPSRIASDMGITKNDREVELIYNDNKKEITIKKLNLYEKNIDVNVTSRCNSINKRDKTRLCLNIS